MLIDCGAIIDKRDKSGLAAIHVACYHGSKDVLSVLLNKGAISTLTDRMVKLKLHTDNHAYNHNV